MTCTMCQKVIKTGGQDFAARHLITHVKQMHTEMEIMAEGTTLDNSTCAHVESSLESHESSEAQCRICDQVIVLGRGSTVSNQAALTRHLGSVNAHSHIDAESLETRDDQKILQHIKTVAAFDKPKSKSFYNKQGDGPEKVSLFECKLCEMLEDYASLRTHILSSGLHQNIDLDSIEYEIDHLCFVQLKASMMFLSQHQNEIFFFRKGSQTVKLKSDVPVDQVVSSPMLKCGSVAVVQEKEEIFHVENLLDVKTKGHSKQYLVKWLGYPPSENTWEPYENVSHLPEMIQNVEAGWQSKLSTTRKEFQCRLCDQIIQNSHSHKIEHFTCTKAHEGIDLKLIKGIDKELLKSLRKLAQYTMPELRSFFFEKQGDEQLHKSKFKCKLCYKILSRSTIKRHIFHPDIHNNIDLNSISGVDIKKFQKIASYANYVANHHQVLVNLNPIADIDSRKPSSEVKSHEPQTVRYQCQLCGDDFVDRWTYQYHALSAEKAHMELDENSLVIDGMDENSIKELVKHVKKICKTGTRLLASFFEKQGHGRFTKFRCKLCGIPVAYNTQRRHFLNSNFHNDVDLDFFDEIDVKLFKETKSSAKFLAEHWKYICIEVQTGGGRMKQKKANDTRNKKRNREYHGASCDSDHKSDNQPVKDTSESEEDYIDDYVDGCQIRAFRKG